MFWDKNYTPAQNIEALLQKENATVEEFLDEDDILQECKASQKSIVNYFTRPDIIRRLVDLIITEPPEDLPMAQRFRHANMACEILTLGIPSLDEKLLADEETLKLLYSYLELEPPLNPLLSSFFSKTFQMLFTKKNGQDWFLYQTMCLKLLEFIKSQNNFLDLICKHFGTPIIPDLIMQMMKSVEGGQLKRNLYEWLTEDKLVQRLIAILGNPQESDKHTNVADFFCDLIQQGRSMRQSDEDNDSFKVAFEESNPILQTIESTETTEALLNVILEPNAQESAIVSGISVILTLIRPVVLADEPNSDRLKYLRQREKEIHEKLLTTVIHAIVPHLEDFNELLRNPPKKPDIVTSAATLSPPFGITRLQICSLFTALLQTRNEDVSDAIIETDFFNTLLGFFKQYCWNNLLHNEVESCIKIIFSSDFVNNSNSTQGSTIVNDGSSGNRSNENWEITTILDNVIKQIDIESIDKGEDTLADNDTKESDRCQLEEANQQNIDEYDESNKENIETYVPPLADVAVPDSTDSITMQYTDNDAEQEDNITKEDENSGIHTNKINYIAPSSLQAHIILDCGLISTLMECWKCNLDSEASKQKRRLGFMGHLIEILKHISNSITENELIGALIVDSLVPTDEVALWQSIINPYDGDLTKALIIQNKNLANIHIDEVENAMRTDDSICEDTLRFGELVDFNLGKHVSDVKIMDDNEYGSVEFRKSPDVEIYNMDSGIIPAFDNPFNDVNFDENFADFDAHFMNFNETENAGISHDPFKSSPFDIEEYDKNANVEKPMSENKDSKNDDAMNAFTIGTEAGTLRMLEDRLGSLSLDYSDDEGMWTKPLGSTLSPDIGDEDFSFNSNKPESTNPTILSNGPIALNNDETQNNIEKNTIEVLSTNTSIEILDNDNDDNKFAFSNGRKMNKRDNDDNTVINATDNIGNMNKTDVTEVAPSMESVDKPTSTS